MVVLGSSKEIRWRMLTIQANEHIEKQQLNQIHIKKFIRESDESLRHNIKYLLKTFIS